MSTQGKAYGHAKEITRQALEKEVGRLKELLGTNNPVVLRNIGRIEGRGGVGVMKDEQLGTYVDLLHRSLPIQQQGIPA